jgi:RNA polymerase sigma-70 factor (ECF subfamily)
MTAEGLGLTGTELLELARAGDGDAFAELAGPMRGELRLHCYRILGSVQDAEDAVQETLTAAWRAIGGFEQRSSLRAWLYRIATNKSLNMLRAGKARAMPAPPAPLPEPSWLGEPLWLEPYPDAAPGDLPDLAPGPEARYEARESISLAFITVLQHLPPAQRAVLILRDVLGFPAAEAAAILDITVDSANGLCKRARATLARDLPPGAAERAPLPGSAAEEAIVERFTDAYQRGDVDAIVALLTDDALLTMPPLPLAYQGRAAIAEFLTAVSIRQRFRLVPVRANGQPAFGCYIRDEAAGVFRAHGLMVLTLAGDQVAAITRFPDNAPLPHFGLPRMLGS